jgi:4-hydroxybenzoyl-CoA reductase subunit beta
MLRLPQFEYLAPKNVDDAIQFLREHDNAMLVAGGTDLFPNMKRRQFEPQFVIGLNGLRELRGVKNGGSTSLTTGFVIGAGTTLTQLSNNSTPLSQPPPVSFPRRSYAMPEQLAAIYVSTRVAITMTKRIFGARRLAIA